MHMSIVNTSARICFGGLSVSLWLARVFILVLVLRNSFGNRPNRNLTCKLVLKFGIQDIQLNWPLVLKLMAFYTFTPFSTQCLNGYGRGPLCRYLSVGTTCNVLIFYFSQLSYNSLDYRSVWLRIFRFSCWLLIDLLSFGSLNSTIIQ